MAAPLPYLDVCGVEVANASRTIDYLRNGLGTRNYAVGVGDPCGVLRRLHGGSCGAPEQFVSPAADPAPWWDPNEPGAATFLGLVLLDVQGYGAVTTRPITARVSGLGGGVFGTERRTAREWKFRAVMVSFDDAGAEYGLRWLTDALQQPACQSCQTCYLVARLACPPDDCSNDLIGKWTSYDTALTAGPTEVEVIGRPDGILAWCRDGVIVEWTMTAANPYLYRDPTVCVSGAQIGQVAPAACSAASASYLGGFYLGGMWLAGADADAFNSPAPPVVCHVTPPTRGTVAPVFQIQTTYGMGQVYLEAYDACPSARWRFIDQVGGGDPGDSNIAFNNAAPASATSVQFDDLEVGGGDGAAFATLLSAVVGRQFRVSLAADPSRYVTYQVTGHTDQVGWTDVAVTYVASSGVPFSVSDVLDVTFTDFGSFDPTQQMLIDHVPANSLVTVNCARRIVTVQTPATTGPPVDGTDLLQVPEGAGGIEWLEARECDATTCFAARAATPCSGGGTDTVVTIQTQVREG